MAQMKRVPGVKRYRAVDSGLRQIGSYSGVGSAALAAAQRIAGNANAVGDSEYAAGRANVTAGFNRETRAGAVVYERLPHPGDAEDRVLKRVVDASAVNTRPAKP